MPQRFFLYVNLIVNHVQEYMAGPLLTAGKLILFPFFFILSSLIVAFALKRKTV